MARAEDSCLTLSELSEVVQQADLGDDDAQALHDLLEARGVEFPTTAAAPGSSRPAICRTRLAQRTTDAMSLFLQEVRRHPLLSREEEVELAKRIEQGDLRGQGAPGQLQPAPGHLQRPQVPGPRAASARPDPGGHPRADQGGGEVRLAQGLQVLHLRHLLDPPGDPARAGQPRSDDPDPRPPGAARAEDRPRPAPSWRPGWAATRPTRRSPRRPSSSSRRSRRPARPLAWSPASTARWARRTRPRSAPCCRAASAARTRRSTSHCARTRCVGRWTGCPSASARWSSCATASAATTPPRSSETGRRLGISSDAVRKLERKALTELAAESRARSTPPGRVGLGPRAGARVIRGAGCAGRPCPAPRLSAAFPFPATPRPAKRNARRTPDLVRFSIRPCGCWRGSSWRLPSPPPRPRSRCRCPACRCLIRTAWARTTRLRRTAGRPCGSGSTRGSPVARAGHSCPRSRTTRPLTSPRSRPCGRRAHQLVVRLNRLFWSDGQAGINAFRTEVDRYAGAGFEVELQVRYHPPQGQAGNIAAWVAYVRHVVDTFGPNRRGGLDDDHQRGQRHLLAQHLGRRTTPGAQDALIAGIEAGHAEAVRRHFGQLRFGFTYAYRFSPLGDAAFFSYLGSHGGPAFRARSGSWGWTSIPARFTRRSSPPATAIAASWPRRPAWSGTATCPRPAIGAGTPIWFTEDGVPTGTNSAAAQAAALHQLVQAARDYSGTFGISDYRWFNLRDSDSGSPAALVGPTFAGYGLLRSDYTRKPSFVRLPGRICLARSIGAARPRAGQPAGEAAGLADTGRAGPPSPVRRPPARDGAPAPARRRTARPSGPRCPSPTGKS